MRLLLPLLLLLFGLVTFPFARMGLQMAREAGSTRRPPVSLGLWLGVAGVGTLGVALAALLQDGVLLPTAIAIGTELALTLASALMFLHGRTAQVAAQD